MATMEDVKRFLAAHGDWSPERMHNEVAREFGMSSEEAAHALHDLDKTRDDPAAVGAAPFANAAIPAAAIVGGIANSSVGGMQAGAGAGLAVVALTEEEQRQRRDLDVADKQTNKD